MEVENRSEQEKRVACPQKWKAKNSDVLHPCKEIEQTWSCL